MQDVIFLVIVAVVAFGLITVLVSGGFRRKQETPSVDYIAPDPVKVCRHCNSVGTMSRYRRPVTADRVTKRWYGPQVDKLIMAYDSFYQCSICSNRSDEVRQTLLEPVPVLQR